MSEIKISCPNCDQQLFCDESHRGMVLDCPACGNRFALPFEEPSLEEPHTEANVCPECRNQMEDGSILCIRCGYNLHAGEVMANPSASSPHQSQALSSMRDVNKNKSLSFWEKFSANFGGLPRSQPKWVWMLSGFLILLLLASLADPSGALFIVYLISSGLLSFFFLLMTAVDAFRNSSVRRGLFVLFLPIYMGRYLNRHCTNLSVRRYGLALVLGVLPGILVGSVGEMLADESGDSIEEISVSMGGQGSGGMADASSPAQVFKQLQKALRKEDFSMAFQHLTEESQLALVSMPIVAVMLSHLSSNSQNPPDPKIAQMKAVLKKHGLSLQAGSFDEKMIRNIKDKGRCFKDMLEVDPELGRPMVDALASWNMDQVVVHGDTAQGKGDGQTIEFRRVGNVWLINLDE